MAKYPIFFYKHDANGSPRLANVQRNTNYDTS